jgi:8-oxo-dGTP pyrophosphatase MutT (NUDIX family)
MKKVNVAGAIIIKMGDEDKPMVLLIQRAPDDHWPHFWEIPRGKCDRGDDDNISKCLKREVKEETGLDIYPIQFVEKFQYVADQGKRLSTQYNFLCLMKNEDQEVKLSKEHSNFKWVYSVGEVELMVNPELKRAIAKAFNYHEQIVNYDMENEVEQKIEESLRRMQ